MEGQGVGSWILPVQSWAPSVLFRDLEQEAQTPLCVHGSIGSLNTTSWRYSHVGTEIVRERRRRQSERGGRDIQREETEIVRERRQKRHPYL